MRILVHKHQDLRITYISDSQGRLLSLILIIVIQSRGREALTPNEQSKNKDLSHTKFSRSHILNFVNVA